MITYPRLLLFIRSWRASRAFRCVWRSGAFNFRYIGVVEAVDSGDTGHGALWGHEEREGISAASVDA